MIRLSLQVFTYHLPLIKCVKGAKLDMKISKLLSSSANSHPAACGKAFLVGEGGFEPPKALPADLQSVPFGHSGTPP